MSRSDLLFVIAYFYTIILKVWYKMLVYLLFVIVLFLYNHFESLV